MQNNFAAVAVAVAAVVPGQQQWAAMLAGGSDPWVVSPWDSLQVQCHREPVASFQKKAGELMN